jgi:hypothetical protein
LVVRVDPQLRLRRGDAVGLKVEKDDIHLFNKMNGKRIAEQGYKLKSTDIPQKV